MTPEVARSDSASRAVFEASLRDVAAVITAGPASSGAPVTVDAACVALATLVGAVTLARAVNDPAMSESIAAATLRALLPPGSEGEGI